MILAIDFDETLHNPYDKEPGYKLGKPIWGAVDAMIDLKRAGHQLIIHTVWASSQFRKAALVDWLEYFSVPFDNVTNIKPDADIYIDNKGYHFTNWEDTMQYLSSYQPAHTG